MTEQGIFDAVANEYDATFTHTAIGRCQREQVWNLLLPLLEGAPQNILELNCGTGEDAWQMARMGHRVLATDASQEMVQVALHKAKSQGLDQRVKGQKMAFSEAEKVLSGQQFDLIFSNFGGLNCIPPRELKELGGELFQHLRPGGHLVAVIMGPATVWEWFYFILKFRFARAFVRLGKKPAEVPLDAKTSQKTWYPGPKSAKSSLGRKFNLIKKAPIGLWTPPGYLEPFFAKRPNWLKRLHERDLKWQKFQSLAGFADHYLIHFQKPD